MSDVEHFALIMLATAAAVVAAVLSNRVSDRFRIPAPAIFLLAAALASDVVPALGQLSVTTVQRVVTVALAVILFDGGMQIGWRRFRQAAGAVVWVGVAGTFVTAAALAVLAHSLFGLDWRAALLLGTFLLTAGEPDATRLYAVIFVVVAFSVIVQGGLVPPVAARLGVPMRTVEPEPWSLGVRFRHEPRGLRRHIVAAGSPADGCTIGELAVGEDVWISLVIRDGQLVPVQGSTMLRAGDEILALTDPGRTPDLTPVFTSGPGPRDADPTLS